MNASAMTAGMLQAPTAQRWRNSLVLGTLWGVAVSAMEAVGLPVQGEGGSGFWPLVEWIVPGWCVVGVGIAALVEFAGARVERPIPVAATVIGCALAFSAIWSWLYSFDAGRDRASGMFMLFPNGVDPVAAYAYQTWIVLFYGGFYYVAWRLNHRAERTRELLGQASVARMRSETLLGEARLQLLRGHVEPGFLLRVITEVEQRYAHAASTADGLLARFVAFLRLAMPAVRSGQSTLAGELALARAYGELCADLESGRSRWTITGETPPDLQFPALLLLPLLDEIAAAAASPFAGTIRVTRDADGLVIGFGGAALERSDWMSPDLLYRIRVALSTLHGDAWSLALNRTTDPGTPALVIVLRSPPAASEASRVADAGSSPPTPEGPSHEHERGTR
jgi:hypothetical protein